MIAKDKQMHMLVGFVIALALVWLSPYLAYLAVVAAALGKEVYDLTGRGTPDAWDFMATIAGAAPVILIGIFYE